MENSNCERTGKTVKLESVILTRKHGVLDDKPFVTFIARVNETASGLINRGFEVQPIQYPETGVAVITYLKEEN